MKCPRCLYKTEVISEYYDYNIQVLVRDTYCTNCKSVLIEKFYEDKKNNKGADYEQTEIDNIDKKIPDAKTARDDAKTKSEQSTKNYDDNFGNTRM